MGEFSKLSDRLINLRIKLYTALTELDDITQDLNKLRNIVKDSKREKIDDVQRQLTKLQERLDKEKQ